MRPLKKATIHWTYSVNRALMIAFLESATLQSKDFLFFMGTLFPAIKLDFAIILNQNFHFCVKSIKCRELCVLSFRPSGVARISQRWEKIGGGLGAEVPVAGGHLASGAQRRESGCKASSRRRQGGLRLESQALIDFYNSSIKITRFYAYFGQKVVLKQ